MSTEITPEALKGKLLVTSFWGGEKDGCCVQLTPPMGTYGCGYAQLTLKEVEELTCCLLAWMAEHYEQKRKLSGTPKLPDGFTEHYHYGKDVFPSGTEPGITTKGQE